MKFLYLDSLFFSSDDILGLQRVLLNALRSISRRHHGEGSHEHKFCTSTLRAVQFIQYFCIRWCRLQFTLHRSVAVTHASSTTTKRIRASAACAVVFIHIAHCFNAVTRIKVRLCVFTCVRVFSYILFIISFSIKSRNSK